MRTAVLLLALAVLAAAALALPAPGEDFYGDMDVFGGSQEVPESYRLRRKRETCWLGEKMCGLKCKFFGKGATLGRCINKSCECLYPIYGGYGGGGGGSYGGGSYGNGYGTSYGTNYGTSTGNWG